MRLPSDASTPARLVCRLKGPPTQNAFYCEVCYGRLGRKRVLDLTARWQIFTVYGQGLRSLVYAGLELTEFLDTSSKHVQWPPESFRFGMNTGRIENATGRLSRKRAKPRGDIATHKLRDRYRRGLIHFARE